MIALYRNRDEIRKVPESEGVEALVQLIKDEVAGLNPTDVVKVLKRSEWTA